MNLALLNKSPTLGPGANSQLVAMAAAIAYQLHYQFAPAHGQLPWSCSFYPDQKLVPRGSVIMACVDHDATPDALGYHDETPGGVLYSNLIVPVVLGQAGATILKDLSSTGSHEAVETAGDPFINTWSMRADGKTLTAYEMGDGTEGDSYPIRVGTGTVLVSNFLFPRWFDPQAPVGTQLDWMHLCSEPLVTRPGGYTIDAAPDPKNPGQLTYSNTWGSMLSPHHAAAKHARTNSRMAKRLGKAPVLHVSASQ